MDRVYFVCRYTPAELLAGYGLSAVRLDPLVTGFDCADGCSHPNLCSYGKAVLETVISRGIGSLLLTDCCDSMRRAYDVLRERGGMEFLGFLPLPHKVGDAECGLFASDLGRLAEELERASGRTFDPQKAISAWEAGRREAAEAAQRGPHISITGAHGGADLAAEAARHFSLPVTDDTCTGPRDLPAPGAPAADRGSFIRALAPALLRQSPPCMRMQAQRTLEPAEGTVGIVYNTVRFCDYYGFDYSRRRAAPGGLPTVKIETDCTPQGRGQLATRLDAFAETLGVPAEPEPAPAASAAAGARYAAGVDSGSASTDAVILDRDRRIVASAVLATGSGAAENARRALGQALRQAGLAESDLAAVVATGYGRSTVGLTDRSVTEITCHARGAHFLDPQARTVIDIGGQDSKVICLDENGSVTGFVMNDKCAAGTGRFLEMMSRALELSLDEMSEKGLTWKNDVTISSVCTVFAESEAVSLVAQNTPVPDIIHGLNKAVAGKTLSLVRRAGGKPGYIMTGGVALNRGVAAALAEKLDGPLNIPPQAQICGAVGAALIALDSLPPES